MENFIGKKVIVRAKNAGVFFGTLKEVDNANGTVILENAKRIYSWNGALSVTDMAVNGILKNSKVTCAVELLQIFKVCEINICSQVAVDSMEGVKIWTKK